MKKFDLIFEKAMFSLREQEEYVDSTFEDNIRALVKTLKDNDFLSKTKDVEAQVKDIMAQPNNVKEIVLDTQENSLPAMKLRTKQDADSESFTVTAIELEKPDQQKTFENSMLETIFDDVVEYIKTAALQGLSPDNAVEELPQAEETLTQPGAEESALPQG